MLTKEDRGNLNIEDVKAGRPPILTQQQSKARRHLCDMGFTPSFGRWMFAPGCESEAIYHEIFVSPRGQVVRLTYLADGSVIC